jgi:hypothetical protein
MSGYGNQMPSWDPPEPSLPPKQHFKEKTKLDAELDDYMKGRGFQKRFRKSRRYNKSRRVSNRRRRNKSIRRRKN